MGERPGPQEPFISTTYVESLKPAGNELTRQENVQLNVVTGIQWTYPREFSGGYGMFLDATPSAPMPPLSEGTTWEEYAQTVPEEIVGILEVKQLQGMAVIDGVEVPLSSKRFYTSGVRYIDGKVYSLEEAAKQPGAPIDVIEGFGILDEKNKAVLTRAGTWEPFEENDSVINTLKTNEFQKFHNREEGYG